MQFLNSPEDDDQFQQYLKILWNWNIVAEQYWLECILVKSLTKKVQESERAVGFSHILNT